MESWLDILTSWGVPWLEDDTHDTTRNTDAARGRARLLIGMCFATAVGGFIMAGVFGLLFDTLFLATITATGSAMITGVPLVIRWSQSITVAANWSSFVVVVTLIGLIPFTGGIASPAVDWIIIAPALALVFGSQISGIIWGVVAVLLLLVLDFIPVTNTFIQTHELVADRDLLKVCSTSVLMGLLTSLLVIFRRHHRELLETASRFEDDASVDPLTNIANRRELNRQLSIHIQRAQRNRNCLALAALDLDAFKSINDTYGHGVGDAVLVEVADRLDETLRDVDVVARSGGDEFIVLLEGMNDAEHFDRVGHRILNCFEEPFNTGNVSIDVNCSVGFGFLPVDTLRWLDAEKIKERAVKLADRAMYESKKEDRNWVVKGLETS